MDAVNSDLQLIAPYLRMAKAGHPLVVVRQRISIDLQCREAEPLLDPIIQYLAEPASQPFPDLSGFTYLKNTKLERMANRGVSKTQIDLTRVYDQLRDRVPVERTVAQESASELAYYISNLPPSKSQQDDRVIGDEDESAKPPLSRAEERALALKNEGAHLRTERVEALIKEVGKLDGTLFEEQENAPLTVETPQAESSVAGQEPFHSAALKFPFPESLSETKIGDATVRTHVPGRLFTVTNVLDTQCCQDVISKFEFSDFEEKLQLQALAQAAEFGLQVVRNNVRRPFIDDSISKKVWSVVKNILPAELPDGRKLCGVRSRMFFYRYGAGQFFTTHVDGGVLMPTGHTAEYTFVLYLNANFSGGQTRFCPLGDWKSQDSENQTGHGGVRDIAPEQGGMLLFTQRNTRHAGVMVCDGLKYIIQGMVLYGPSSVNQFGKPIGEAPNVFQQLNCDC